MKRLLLTVTCLGLLMTVHAQYNVFDAADVDEQGWLWFDSQAKIDKYVGLEGSGKLLQPIMNRLKMMRLLQILWEQVRMVMKEVLKLRREP